MSEDEEEKVIDRQHEKNAIRRDLDKHVAEYLARGGKIQFVEFGEMTQEIDMRDVTFRTRMEREVVKVKAEKQENRQRIIRQISEGRPINLFSDE